MKDVESESCWSVWPPSYTFLSFSSQFLTGYRSSCYQWWQINQNTHFIWTKSLWMSKKRAINTVRCLWLLVSVTLLLVSSRVLTHFEGGGHRFSLLKHSWAYLLFTAWKGGRKSIFPMHPSVWAVCGRAGDHCVVWLVLFFMWCFYSTFTGYYCLWVKPHRMMEFSGYDIVPHLCSELWPDVILPMTLFI